MSDTNDSYINSKNGTISNLSVRDRMNLWKNRESETHAKSPTNPSSSKKPEDGHHTSSSLAKFQNKSVLAHESSPRLSFESSHSSEKIGSSDNIVLDVETKLKSASISSGSVLSPLKSTQPSPIEITPLKPTALLPAASSVAVKNASTTATPTTNASANSNKSNPPSKITASPLSPTTPTNSTTTPIVTTPIKKLVVSANKIKIEVSSDSIDHTAAIASPVHLVSKPPSSPVKKTAAAKIPTIIPATVVNDNELHKSNATVSSSADARSSNSLRINNNSNNVSLAELTNDVLINIAKYESVTTNGSASTISVIQDLSSSLNLLKQSLISTSSSSSMPSSSSGNSTVDCGITCSSAREAELNANNKKEIEMLQMNLLEAKQKIVILEQLKHRDLSLSMNDNTNKDNPSSMNNNQLAVENQKDNVNNLHNLNLSSSSSQPSIQQQQLPRQPPIHVIIDEEDGKLRIMISKNKRRIMTQEYKV